jgi:hypothetical protein
MPRMPGALTLSLDRMTRLDDRQKMLHKWGLVGLSLLITYVVGCAIYIETLNGMAGGILPRDTKHSTANRRWRIAADRGISSAIDVQHALAEVEVTSERRKWERKLRYAVETFGLTQYLVAPLTLISGIWWLIMQRGRCANRLLGCLAIASGAAAFCIAYGRQYFDSLGM